MYRNSPSVSFLLSQFTLSQKIPKNAYLGDFLYIASILHLAFFTNYRIVIMLILTKFIELSRPIFILF